MANTDVLVLGDTACGTLMHITTPLAFGHDVPARQDLSGARTG
ncbi:hypothetical protein [Sulfobacillus thermosulfidooxidans]|nr:hypothetical protein [Sulfobacillus thermosulfidooxidans]